MAISPILFWAIVVGSFLLGWRLYALFHPQAPFLPLNEVRRRMYDLSREAYGLYLDEQVKLNHDPLQYLAWLRLDTLADADQKYQMCRKFFMEERDDTA